MPIHDWTRVEAGIFDDFHHEWISTIKRALNAGLLPSPYYALAEQVAGGLGPDVLTLEYELGRSKPGNGKGGDSASERNGGIALAAAPPQVRFTATADAEAYVHKRKHIAIRHSSDDRVVAFVEIVSPGNKGSRRALWAFIDKSIELLTAGIHLMVIDLFPPSRRDPEGIHHAIWSELKQNDFQLPPDQRLTLASYAAGEPKRAFIEPVRVGDALPEMPLFLTPERYINVPLEPTYLAAFDAVPRRWRDVLGPAS
ncbi:MAG: DUF4058 family protein [Planctomycetes bacterium]|nr:DUF4058 family protein [Planctomycetota bacterium]